MIQVHSHAHGQAPSLRPPGLSPLYDGLNEEAQVTLRHLKTPREIEAVLSLRDGIDLSAHASAADFRSLEKKETKLVLSARSSAVGA